MALTDDLSYSSHPAEKSGETAMAGNGVPFGSAVMAVNAALAGSAAPADTAVQSGNGVPFGSAAMAVNAALSGSAAPADTAVHAEGAATGDAMVLGGAAVGGTAGDAATGSVAGGAVAGGAVAGGGTAEGAGAAAAGATVQVRANILDPGFNLTLRPMRYPRFFEMYKDAIKNTWTVEEIDFSDDITDLDRKLMPAEKHLISRLVAFFATGDSIVANNLVLNLYEHINAPEARMYLSRQLYEEALHVQFYLNLLDSYIPDADERAEAFAAIENIPSIRRKAEFCFKWMDSVGDGPLRSAADRRRFLLNLVCFAACIEGLFFFAAFAYVYFLRSKGLLNGLAAGTNWVFRDESMHMNFAFAVIETVRAEEPELFDDEMSQQIADMLAEAVDAEYAFAEDLLGEGVPGMSTADTRRYLEFVADQRLLQLGLPRRFGSANPFAFMELQDVQELSNFFERTVSAYQIGVAGDVAFDEEF